VASDGLFVNFRNHANGTNSFWRTVLPARCPTDDTQHSETLLAPCSFIEFHHSSKLERWMILSPPLPYSSLSR
jgi:hypothetical protein